MIGPAPIMPEAGPGCEFFAPPFWGRTLVGQTIGRNAAPVRSVSGRMGFSDLAPDLQSAHHTFVRTACGCAEIAGREPAACDAGETRRTAVFLTLGQSQAANSGETLFAPPERVFNLNPFDGRLYGARDPLLGCTDEGGNFASRLGYLLVRERGWASVVLLPIGVGGSAIAEWSAGGVHHHRLAAAAASLRVAGLTATAVLWAQGEADAVPGADGERYRLNLLQIVRTLRSLGIAAPVFVAVSTFCSPPSDGNAAIRAAQRAAVAPADGIFAGPDTDRLGIAYRFDYCHFNDEGLWAVARMWADALSARLRPD